MDRSSLTDHESTPEDGDDPSRISGRAEARRLRESFDAAERDRIETTVSDLLDTIGKAQAMAVLREFAFASGPLRFSDLEDALETSPSTLSARLRELTAAGLLDRTEYGEVPPRVEYEPTDRAVDLFPVFAHLHHWAIEYATDATESGNESA